jgi:hypothetical protein
VALRLSQPTNNQPSGGRERQNLYTDQVGGYRPPHTPWSGMGQAHLGLFSLCSSFLLFLFSFLVSFSVFYFLFFFLFLILFIFF